MLLQIPLTIQSTKKDKNKAVANPTWPKNKKKPKNKNPHQPEKKSNKNATTIS